jgi:hypothetical protein
MVWLPCATFISPCWLIGFVFIFVVFVFIFVVFVLIFVVFVLIFVVFVFIFEVFGWAMLPEHMDVGMLWPLCPFVDIDVDMTCPFAPSSDMEVDMVFPHCPIVDTDVDMPLSRCVDFDAVRCPILMACLIDMNVVPVFWLPLSIVTVHNRLHV